MIGAPPRKLADTTPYSAQHRRCVPIRANYYVSGLTTSWAKKAHDIVGILIAPWLTTSWAWRGCCHSVTKGGTMADHHDELYWRRQAIRLRLKGWRPCEILTL